MADILFLVVVFNKSFDESDTLKSLKEGQSIFGSSAQLIVWDNSMLPQLDIDTLKNNFLTLNGVSYTNTKQNLGISEIYNKVINSNLGKHKWLVLLDDDTWLTEEYFKEIILLLQTNKDSYLFLPRIISNNTLVSPAKLYYFFGRYLSYIEPGITPSKHLMAINSGMVIKLSYFEKYDFRYDEYLRFYGTDNNFMMSYSRNVSECYVMQSELSHSLSQFDLNESVEKKAYRFRQILKGTLHLNRKNYFVYILAHIYVLCKSVISSVKYRSFKFIYYLWKN